MASRKTLNASNLECLGAARLAALLLEISEGNPAVKRRLRMELVGAESPAELGKAIRKRLVTIARARSFVDWQNRKALVEDLQAQRRTIAQQVATRDPAEALELMWQFLGLAGRVLERTEDNNGAVIGVFHAAVQDLGAIAQAARPDPESLAGQVFRALVDNGYGQYDELIQCVRPALGAAGLQHLKQRMLALSDEPVQPPPAEAREVIGWSSRGAIYADELAEHARTAAVRQALLEIADAQGDVEAYIGQYAPEVRKVRQIAAEIAQRLLAAGRLEEAWQALEATEDTHPGLPEFEWEDMRIEVLDALGRGDQAQAARWSCFERFLSEPHLRAYLKRLPDFDDFEAEQRALEHAERYDNKLHALAFLIAWPALDRAARLVAANLEAMDGNFYDVLTPAAEALAGKYPLQATLLLRAMINFAVEHGRSSRYGHAARHLRECAGLASGIADFDPFESHEAYVARLRRDHGRKTGFWNAVG